MDLFREVAEPRPRKETTRGGVGLQSYLSQSLVSLLLDPPGYEQPLSRAPTATDWVILLFHHCHEGLEPTETVNQNQNLLCLKLSLSDAVTATQN